MDDDPVFSKSCVSRLLLLVYISMFHSSVCNRAIFSGIANFRSVGQRLPHQLHRTRVVDLSQGCQVDEARVVAPLFMQQRPPVRQGSDYGGFDFTIRHSILRSQMCVLAHISFVSYSSYSILRSHMCALAPSIYNLRKFQ